MCHTPPGESCPRYVEWVWDPDPTSGNPEKLGPAEALARWPPHARPVRPRLRESSPRPAPHSPLTLARAAEPGSGIPCGCRMPSGRARRGDQVSGYSRAREAAEGTAGGRPGRASFRAAAATRPEPKESLAERGVAPRGAEGPLPCSAPPCPWRPAVPTGERPPPARYGSGSTADAPLPGTDPRTVSGGDGGH